MRLNLESDVAVLRAGAKVSAPAPGRPGNQPSQITMAKRGHETATQIGQRLQRILPEIAGRSAQFETLRRIPLDIVEKLKHAGCFRMAVPSSMGGAELCLEDRLRVIEEIAIADGSCGWTVALGNESPIALSRCTSKAFNEIYEAGPNVIIAGGTAPSGTADVVEGGYNVEGRWAWGSGSLHADLFLMNCVVKENGTALPETRTMVLTPDQVEVLDTWRSNGLCGTGSHDIIVRQAFVRNERSMHLLAGDSCFDGPIYKSYPAQSPMHFSAVALGIAQGALNELKGLAIAGKQRLYASTKLAESQTFQYKLGFADATLYAARASLHDCARLYTRDSDSIASGFMQLFDPLTKFCNATAAWVAVTAAGVVDTAYHLGGGSSALQVSPLQRRLRDIHTLTQHISFSDAIITRYGASLVGLDDGM